MSYPTYEAYKDTFLNWLGEIPSHWQQVRLGQFFNERREKVSDKDFSPLSVTKKGIVPQLESAAKTDAGDNRKKVCRGDFVINSRSDRKGSSGVSNQEGSVSLISIVMEPRDISSSYVNHLLRSQPFQEEFYRFGKGIVADLWSTNYSEMKNINIPIPSASEQTQIAAFLDKETAKIDILIEKQEKLIKLLQEKRQAVISHAVTKGLNPDVKMKDSGVEWLGEVPDHWEVISISTLNNKITNGYVGPTRDIFYDEGIRYLQSLHIKNNKINFHTPFHVAPEWSEQKAKSILKKGDVLIVQTGDIGQVAAVPDEFEGCNCHALIIVSTTNKIDGFYLSWVLNSDYGFHSLKSIQTGALHPHLNCDTVKAVKVPVPPISEQLDIKQYADYQSEKFGTLITTAISMIELMKERRTALISAAVTGKIDVRNVAV